MSELMSEVSIRNKLSIIGDQGQLNFEAASVKFLTFLMTIFHHNSLLEFSE